MNTTVEFYLTPSWMAATTISVFCWIMLFWILLSLLCYGAKNKKWKRATPGKNVEEKNAAALFAIAITSTAFSLVHTTLNLVVYNFGYHASTMHTCTIGVIVSVEFFAFTMSWCYLFLWLKQHAIYQHNIFSHLYNTWLKVFSWCSLALMLVGLNSAVILYNSFSKFETSSFGCLNKGDNWPALYGTVVNGSGQLIMLGLFIYPVTKIPNTRSSCRIIKILKRATICTAVCVVSDLVAGIYVGVSNTSDKVGLALYNLNLVLNVVALLLTFETWTDILLSPCYFKYPLEPPMA